MRGGVRGVRNHQSISGWAATRADRGGHWGGPYNADFSHMSRGFVHQLRRTICTSYTYTRLLLLHHAHTPASCPHAHTPTDHSNQAAHALLSLSIPRTCLLALKRTHSPHASLSCSHTFSIWLSTTHMRASLLGVTRICLVSLCITRTHLL